METNTQVKLHFLVRLILSGDKYLHENSLNNRKDLWLVGALLYLCVFVLNEFIWRFIPYRGIFAVKFLMAYPMFFFVIALSVLLVTRRLLFGINPYRPDPAIGMPDRTSPRMDYQNVIPAYGEKKWLRKRLESYVDLQCSMIIDVVLGWGLVDAFFIPYFLFQK